MPAIWENKLRLYKKQQKEKEDFRKEAQALAPGRSFDVAQRVFYLYEILEHLVKNGDEVEQIPNAKAIISAYKAGDLEWSTDGKVTYWHKGVQICEPKDWDIDDFVEVSKIAEGKGFWVEGVSYRSKFKTLSPNDSSNHFYLVLWAWAAINGRSDGYSPVRRSRIFPSLYSL